MVALIGAYVLIGIAAAGISTLAIDGIDAPPGSQPAIMFVVGLIWPVVLLGVVLYAVCYAALDVGHGFAVLWRHARARVEARERPPDKPTTDRQEGN